MKRLILWLSLIAQLAFGVDQSPTNWWKITSSDTAYVRDWVSNSNATYQPSIGSGPTLITSNAINFFMSFDGLSSYLDAGNCWDMNTNAWTASFWIYPAALSDGTAFISKWSSADNYRGSALEISNGGRLRCYQIYSYGGANVLVYSDPSLISIGSWWHICWTHSQGSDATNLNLYVNGINHPLSITFNNLGVLDSTTSIPLQIGGGGGVDANYSGYMDDIKLFKTCITSSEVYNITTAGRSPDVNPGAPTINIRMYKGDATHNYMYLPIKP